MLEASLSGTLSIALLVFLAGGLALVLILAIVQQVDERSFHRPPRPSAQPRRLPAVLAAGDVHAASAAAPSACPICGRAIRQPVATPPSAETARGLRGSRTYVTATVGIVIAVVMYLSGELSGLGCLAAVWAGLQMVFLRAGIKRDLQR